MKKRLLSIIVIGCTAVSMAACGAPQAEAPAEEPVAVEEAAEAADEVSAPAEAEAEDELSAEEEVLSLAGDPICGEWKMERGELVLEGVDEIAMPTVFDLTVDEDGTATTVVLYDGMDEADAMITEGTTIPNGDGTYVIKVYQEMENEIVDFSWLVKVDGDDLLLTDVEEWDFSEETKEDGYAYYYMVRK